MNGERLLVHGPALRDLTDFLYYDQVVYPATMAYVRPRTLAPGYVGYPLKEPLPEAVRERLSAAKLIVASGVVTTVPSGAEFAAALARGPEGFMASLQESAAAAAATLGKALISTLEVPATEADVQRWVQELDGCAKTIADLAVDRGKRAVAKFHAEDVTGTLKAGWTPVLCLTLRGLPGFRPGPGTLEAMIAFLGDAETRRLRQSLFDWHVGLPEAVAGGATQLNEIPERIGAALTAYRSWIAASGLASGSFTADLLLAFDAPVVEAVSALAVPPEHRGAFALGKRGLSAPDLSIPGRELAWISHAKRGFRDFWPG